MINVSKIIHNSKVNFKVKVLLTLLSDYVILKYTPFILMPIIRSTANGLSLLTFFVCKLYE